MRKSFYFVFLFIFFLLLHSDFNLMGARLFITENTKVSRSEETKIKYTQNELNSLYSTKQLGAVVENGNTTFRLFTPHSAKVELVTFDNVEDSTGITHLMERDDQGVWEIKLQKDLTNKYYAFRCYSEVQLNKNIIPPLVIDPYAKAVATFTDYMNPRKSIVYNDDYDWGNDEWIQQDWRDLIIYEAHIRDLTAHTSSESTVPGTYQGLIQEEITGGLNYVKSLGVNTIELLPSQEYGYFEIPFKDSLNGHYNTWNPYERNHWGYMTSNFFAPAAYYAENIQKLERGYWIGKEGKQVKHFKDMVKAFHKKGIAVMMDVVFNHLSEYELGNLKEIDKKYYFRLDDNGNYIAESYCGNDLMTERPMLRKLIIDSIVYWMKEYHIDGFRFDLGKLIDWQTIEEIIRTARRINPDVIFVCEPWGGGYDPAGFSLREWGSWNDQIRNGIKGENPFNGRGWIFGEWYNNNSTQRIKSYIRGTLAKDKYGLFQKPKHSVNYLASHDGYTLGDFIRLGLGKVKKDETILNVDENVKLSKEELKLHKLAAMFLFSAQGITMIHSGQEFARSKVIFNENNINDPHVGQLDHNSYNKDNETNYINYKHAEINKDLVNYYKGLIKLRKKHEAFKKALYENYTFIEFDDNPFALAYKLEYFNNTYYVALNANRKDSVEIKLPDDVWWKVLADKNKSMSSSAKSIKGNIILEPSTGIILMRKN